MKNQNIVLISVISLSLGLSFAESKYGASLKSAATSAGASVEATKKKAEDSAKMVAESAAKKTSDSLKTVAATAEMNAKRIADSLKAIVLKTHKDSTKKVTPAPTSAPVENTKVETTAPAPVAKASASAKIAFGTSVEDKEIQGEATEFAAGTVSTWSRLALGAGAVKVKHVWYKEGKMVKEIAMTSKSGTGRVWSNATVTAGKWKVEVVSEAGDIVASGEFTVK